MQVAEIDVLQIFVDIAEIDKQGMRQLRVFLIGENVLKICKPPAIATIIDILQAADTGTTTNAVLRMVIRTVVGDFEYEARIKIVISVQANEIGNFEFDDGRLIIRAQPLESLVERNPIVAAKSSVAISMHIVKDQSQS